MSHLFDTGFSVRQPSWHGLADIRDDYPTDWAQARDWAGLNWEVLERQIPVFDFDKDGQPFIVTGPDGQPTFEKDHKKLIRSDTGHTLSMVSDGYSVIGMDDFGQIMTAVLEQGNIKYETAGSLDDGRMVWALAYLDEPITLPGDNSPTMPYVSLQSRHDGRGSAQLIPTNVRVICANTFRAAEMQGEGNGSVYSFRHTKNWRDRVEEAKLAIKGARASFEKYKALAEELTGLSISKLQEDWFVESFFPYPPEGEFTSRVRSNIDAARGEMRALLASKTCEIPSTVYRLVQAAGEYSDHVRPYQNQKTYFGRTLIRPQVLKQRAMTLARKAAAQPAGGTTRPPAKKVATARPATKPAAKATIGKATTGKATTGKAAAKKAPAAKKTTGPATKK